MYFLIIVVCFKTELYTVDSVIEPSPTIPNIAQGGCVRYTDLTIILLITPVVLVVDNLLKKEKGETRTWASKDSG